VWHIYDNNYYQFLEITNKTETLWNNTHVILWACFHFICITVIKYVKPVVFNGVFWHKNELWFFITEFSDSCSRWRFVCVVSFSQINNDHAQTISACMKLNLLYFLINKFYKTFLEMLNMLHFVLLNIEESFNGVNNGNHILGI